MGVIKILEFHPARAGEAEPTCRRKESRKHPRFILPARARRNLGLG
jgi:hypothetical protein